MMNLRPERETPAARRRRWGPPRALVPWPSWPRLLPGGRCRRLQRDAIPFGADFTV